MKYPSSREDFESSYITLLIYLYIYTLFKDAIKISVWVING
jgi:hypothetical protein